MTLQTKKRALSALTSLILLLDITHGYVVDHGDYSDHSEYYRFRPQEMIRRSYNQRRGSSDNNNFSADIQRPSYGSHEGERITSQKYNIGRDSMNFGPVSNGNEYNGYLNLKESEPIDSYSNIPVERDSSEEIVYGGHENKKENFGGYFNSKEGAMFKGWSNSKDLSREGSGGYGKVISLKPSYGKGSSNSGGGSGFSSGYSSGTGGYSSGGPVQKTSATSYVSGLGSSHGGYGPGSGGGSSGYGPGSGGGSSGYGSGSGGGSSGYSSRDGGHKGGEHKGYTQATFISTKTDHSDAGHGHEHGGHSGHDEGHDHHNDGYEFEYTVHDPHTHDFKSQKEHSDGHVVKGQYTVVQPDGLLRTVDYTADWKTGFQAKVHYSPAPKVDEHDEHAYSSANFNLFNKGHH